MKLKCNDCIDDAIWMYMPASDVDYNYCDKHVPRGCSCNIDEETNEEDLDSIGRKYPCVEYAYDADGFEYDN